MQSAHEQCFLCRRAQPDRYVYYKDYNELEGKLQRILSQRVLPLHLSLVLSNKCEIGWLA